MSAISALLTAPPNNFSTTLSAGIASNDLTIPLNSVSGLGTEGIGVLYAKDTSGNPTASSIEFIHWTNTSGNNLTLTDTGDRGVSGSASGAQAHSAGDTFEVWTHSSYYPRSALLAVLTSAGLLDTTKVVDLTTAQTMTNKILTQPGIDIGVMTEQSSTPSTPASGKANIYIDTSHQPFVQSPNGIVSPLEINKSMARQAIINGNFDIWQRGISFTPLDVTSVYLADKFASYIDKNGGTLPTLSYSRQLQTSGALQGSYYFLRLTTNGAGTSLGNSSIGEIFHKMENGVRNLCGNGKKVTVSFYAKSNIANKRLGVYIQQDYGTGGSPTSTETITGSIVTLTSSWVKYSFTFTTNTLSGKTFGTNNNDSIILIIENMFGSTIATSHYGGGGAETYVGSGNIDMAQIQLCSGDISLPFQPKSYEDEIRACRRYCFQISGDAYSHFAPAQNISTTIGTGQLIFPVEMRTTPTLESAGNFGVTKADNTIQAATAVALDRTTKLGTSLNFTVASGLVAGNASRLIANNDATAYLRFVADL